MHRPLGLKTREVQKRAAANLGLRGQVTVNDEFIYNQIMRHSIGHTSVHRGKRVAVRLQDTTLFVARFKERKGKTIYFYDHQPLATKDIYNLTIIKD